MQLTSFISLFLRNIIIMQVPLSISLRLNLWINLDEFWYASGMRSRQGHRIFFIPKKLSLVMNNFLKAELRAIVRYE